MGSPNSTQEPTSSDDADFAGLTPEQRKRLDEIRSEIRSDKLIVSFSIEARDINGVRKSAFYSVTASRKQIGSEDDDATGVGWTVDEAKVVHSVLSQQVVAAVYSDAVRRGILLPHVAQDEAKRILGGYEKQIARLLGSGGSK